MNEDKPTLSYEEVRRFSGVGPMKISAKVGKIDKLKLSCVDLHAPVNEEGVLTLEFITSPNFEMPDIRQLENRTLMLVFFDKGE